jgi:hypothetical protein
MQSNYGQFYANERREHAGVSMLQNDSGHRNHAKLAKILTSNDHAQHSN